MNSDKTVLPSSDVHEKAFNIAEVMASRREQALQRAISHYFGENSWDEDVLREHGHLECAMDGAELFLIKGTPLVSFGPVESKIDIHNNYVDCLYYQEIKEIYLL